MSTDYAGRTLSQEDIVEISRLAEELLAKSKAPRSEMTMEVSLGDEIAARPDDVGFGLRVWQAFPGYWYANAIWKAE
jgi:hypothetical protein